MAILLSSANNSVIMRWAGHLSGHFETEKTLSISELKTLCTTRKFDAILLHRMLIDMPAFSGLLSLSPTARFFLLSDRPDEEEALSFLKLGIVGYGNTYISAPRLLEALRVVTNGGVWLGQKIIQRLIVDTLENAKEDSKKKDNTASALAKLTRAERNIAELVARGESNLEIAADLKITERTVKAHLTSIYEKTKTGNRLNLALLINLGKSPQS
jgi:two-component system, NarL family, nitrate/nitrite response regulator NarL